MHFTRMVDQLPPSSSESGSRQAASGCSLGCGVVMIPLLLFGSLIIHNWVHSTKAFILRQWLFTCESHVDELQAAQEKAMKHLPTEAPQQKILDLAWLRHAGYLKDNLICPASGAFLLNIASPTPVVFCSFHGSRRHLIPGKVDPKHPFFWWLRYILLRIGRRNSL